MNTQNSDIKRFDDCIQDDSNIAALVMRQYLESVEGKDGVIFPPTFARPEGVSSSEWTGYNIDTFDDGNVCQIDSVGSQANRMEPIFKKDDYKHLVPQVSIRIGDDVIHILDAGHRAADAIVRFASHLEDESDSIILGEELWKAFSAFQRKGDAELLARTAPTTCLFGAWDSRATQAKLPRIVRSVVRAYNVNPHTRSAQYNSPIHYVNEGVIDEKLDKGRGDQNPLSREGFLDNPATGSHGGIEVKGEIRRDAIINLAALRSLGTVPDGQMSPEDVNTRTLELRRYILGLALVALSHRSDQTFNLREGCLLRVAKPTTWKLAMFEGDDQHCEIRHEDVLSYATGTAAAFGVQQFDKPFVFDRSQVNKWLSKSREQQDRIRRTGPIIKQGL